jgi:hypothetical protein
MLARSMLDCTPSKPTESSKMALIDQLISNMLGPEIALTDQNQTITVEMGKRWLMAAITGNRTVPLGNNTLSGSNPVTGDRIEIRLTAATQFRLIVQNSAKSVLTELRAPGVAVFVFDGSDWSFEARSSWNEPAVFNVKDFGARGDDSTNDREAIQGALDAMRDTGYGGVVYLPPGFYRVRGDSLKLPRLGTITQCYMVGEGRDGVMIIRDDATTTAASLTFTPSTITRGSADTGSFVADGWAIGKRVIVSGTGRNNTHGVPLTLTSVTDKTLTFGPLDSLVNEVAGTGVLGEDAPLFEGDDRDALPKSGIEANQRMGFWTFRDMTWSALNCTVFRWNFGDLIDWTNSTYRLTAVFENILLRPSTHGRGCPLFGFSAGSAAHSGASEATGSMVRAEPSSSFSRHRSVISRRSALRV